MSFHFSDLEESNGFVVTESDCNLNTQKKYETVLCLGNGYMGMRNSFCEPCYGQSRLTLIAGLYDKQPKEEEELIPLPDVAELMLTANGTPIGPLQNHVMEYSRSLDLKNGLSSYSYRHILDDKNAGLSVTQQRFVSMENPHLVVFETVIKADADIDLSATTAINGRQTVDGTQHSFLEECTVLRDHTLWYSGKTVVSQTDFCVGLRAKCYFNGKELNDAWRYASVRRKISMSANIALSKGDELRIVRYALFYTAHDPEWSSFLGKGLTTSVLQKIDCVSQKSFSGLLHESEVKWDEVWNCCDIAIKSDDVTENLKIRLALYHMIIMCASNDDRVSIAAKGLTSMGYAGHVFWDCELFNLPFFTYTNPSAARNLCVYRYRTLNGARKKASEFGFLGAMYPWESASESGEEQAPRYKNYAPDNTPRHVLCGEIEHHVTCDVAYGIYSYFQFTNDRAFMEQYGYEILFETADFWQSRLDYHSENDRYEILRVIGPDEYKECVDNDVFTNYMVEWNLKTALSEAEALQKNFPGLFETFESTIGLTRLMKEIRQKLPKLYLPTVNKDGLIPQNDTYLSLTKIDLSKYKNSGVNRLIQKDYSMSQISKLMVSKQADLIQLIALMPNLFDKETVKRNFDFYEERCIHDSSLSLSAFAMVAVQCYDADYAHLFFARALDTDFGKEATLCNEGIHAANCGGIWQDVIFGFAGISMKDGVLKINPSIPSAWKELSIRMVWDGCKTKITIDINHITVETTNEKEVQAEILGQRVSFVQKVSITR